MCISIFMPLLNLPFLSWFEYKFEWFIQVGSQHKQTTSLRRVIAIKTFHIYSDHVAFIEAQPVNTEDAHTPLFMCTPVLAYTPECTPMSGCVHQWVCVPLPWNTQLQCVLVVMYSCGQKYQSTVVLIRSDTAASFWAGSHEIECGGWRREEGKWEGNEPAGGDGVWKETKVTMRFR